MLRFGGGRALTKQVSDEAAVKCHVTLEGANKMVEDNAKMVDVTALVVCGAQLNPEGEGKPKLALVKARMGSLRSRLGKIMGKLYNLESNGEPEKRLNVDLDLYQMENY